MSSSNSSSSHTQSEQTPNTQTANPHSWPGNPNGKGIVRNGYIYSIANDSPLMAEYEKLTDKEERCKFMLEHGKKQGPVGWDTRRQPLRDVVEHGEETRQ
jgi:hypothetical protein